MKFHKTIILYIMEYLNINACLAYNWTREEVAEQLKRLCIDKKLADSPIVWEAIKEKFLGKLDSKPNNPKPFLDSFFPDRDKNAPQDEKRLDLIGYREGVDFYGSRVESKRIHANMTAAIFLPSDITWKDSYFHNCIAIGAQLPKTIDSCTFNNCDFRLAGFSHSHIYNSQFPQSDFEQTNLTYAQFEKVDFRNAKNLDKAVYKADGKRNSNATFIECTFPEGLDLELLKNKQARIFNTKEEYNKFIKGKHDFSAVSINQLLPALSEYAADKVEHPSTITPKDDDRIRKASTKIDPATVETAVRDGLVTPIRTK